MQSTDGANLKFLLEPLDQKSRDMDIKVTYSIINKVVINKILCLQSKKIMKKESSVGHGPDADVNITYINHHLIKYQNVGELISNNNSFNIFCLKFLRVRSKNVRQVDRWTETFIWHESPVSCRGTDTQSTAHNAPLHIFSSPSSLQQYWAYE